MSGFDVHPTASDPVRITSACALFAALAALAHVLAFAAPAAAQADAVPTPTTPLVITESDADPAIDPDSPVGEIIPRPNTGARPERPGDRGGSLQLGLFALLLTFLAVAAWRIAVTGRRGRQAYAAQAQAPPAGTTTVDTQVGDSVSGGSEPEPRDG